MTDRYESWVDRQIREAAERGEFDDLPGTGKPLPDRGESYDEDWWLKELIKRENVSGVLPPALAIRRELQDLRETLAQLKTESAVRAHLVELNRRIREIQLGYRNGPAVVVRTVDVEAEVRAWLARR